VYNGSILAVPSRTVNTFAFGGICDGDTDRIIYIARISISTKKKLRKNDLAKTVVL